MSQKKYTKRIAATAGSLACIAAAPATSEAGIVTVTGSPVSLAVSDAPGTSVTWDIDGVGIGEFRLHKRYSNISLASNTAGYGQGNGRGLLGPPFFTDNVQALQASFNVGPSVAPYVWGNGNGFFADRNAMSSFGGIGFDFNYGFAHGDNFDTVNAIVSITEWTYQTLDDTAVHVGSTAAVPEPSSLALLACGAVGLMAYRRRRSAAKVVDEAPTELPA